MTVALLITELMRFQTRAILKDEVKGKMRKRVVFGFREVSPPSVVCSGDTMLGDQQARSTSAYPAEERVLSSIGERCEPVDDLLCVACPNSLQPVC